MFYLDNEIKSDDKYDICKFLAITDDGAFDPLSSYFLYKLPSLSIQGYYTIKREENRPDLLSYNLYQDTQYWWILMLYNGLLKPQDLTNGLTIKYPSLPSIEQLYLQLSLYEKTKAWK